MVPSQEVVACILLAVWLQLVQSENKRKNVLFVVVDDLRPALGCYGDTQAVTPNIDAFSKIAVQFNRAYAQQALCGPSRTSFLTSRRPDTLCLYDVGSYWRRSAGNFTTIPQYFKDSGYTTYSVGKVFHPGIVSGHNDDMPFSWSAPAYHPPSQKFKNDPVCVSTWDGRLHTNIVCPVDTWKQPFQTLPDLQSLERARQFIQNQSDTTPFFLAVGFHKPHIPLKYPWEYLFLHPLANVPLPPDPTRPKKMPVVAWNPWNDLRKRDDISRLNLSFPFGPMPDEESKLIRQSYYAATSYMDDLFGRLLSQLSQSGFLNNTVVVLLGDHGWSLGEHQEWSKYSNFEVSVRVPLLIYPSGITNFTYFTPFGANKHATTASGKSTDALVELVDLFPTLADLAGLQVPPVCPLYSRKVDLCTEGVSLAPLVRGTGTTLGKYAFSQFPRPSLHPSVKPDSDQPKRKDINIMGYSIRTQRYRYTRWVRFNHTTCEPYQYQVVASELYDHVSDPLEDHNMADAKSYKAVSEKLQSKLWKGLGKNGYPYA